MKKLLLFITTLMLISCYDASAQFKSLYDLLSSTQARNGIQRTLGVHKDINKGAMELIMVSATGKTIDYIRFYPCGVAGQCYQVLNVVNDPLQFGATGGNSVKTLLSLGYTQTMLNFLYPSSMSITPADLTDYAGVQKCFYATSRGYGSINASTDIYYISKMVNMYTINTITYYSTGGVHFYDFDWNGSVFKRSGILTTPLFGYLNEVGDSTFNWYIANRLNVGWKFHNATVDGGGVGTLIRVNGGYHTQITDCSLRNADTLIVFRFCLAGNIERINASFYNHVGAFIDRQKCGNCGLSDAASNVTKIDKWRGFPTAGAYADLWIFDASDVRVTDITFDGGTRLVDRKSTFGIYFDSGNATVVKDFIVDGVHSERYFDSSMVHCEVSSGSIVQLRNLYPQATPSTVYCALSVRGYSGFSDAVVENVIDPSTVTMKFASSSRNSTQGVRWWFKRVKAYDPIAADSSGWRFRSTGDYKPASGAIKENVGASY